MDAQAGKRYARPRHSAGRDESDLIGDSDRICGRTSIDGRIFGRRLRASPAATIIVGSRRRGARPG